MKDITKSAIWKTKSVDLKEEMHYIACQMQNIESNIIHLNLRMNKLERELLELKSIKTEDFK